MSRRYSARSGLVAAALGAALLVGCGGPSSAPQKGGAPAGDRARITSPEGTHERAGVDGLGLTRETHHGDEKVHERRGSARVQRGLTA